MNLLSSSAPRAERQAIDTTHNAAALKQRPVSTVSPLPVRVQSENVRMLKELIRNKEAYLNSLASKSPTIVEPPPPRDFAELQPFALVPSSDIHQSFTSNLIANPLAEQVPELEQPVAMQRSTFEASHPDTTDAQLLASLVTLHRLARRNLDLQGPKPLNAMKEQVSSHSFHFTSMTDSDLAVLYVTLSRMSSVRSDVAMQKIGDALRQRMPELGSEMQGLTAALENLFSTELQLLIQNLAEKVTEGLRSRSPRHIAAAVDSARQAYSNLVQLQPTPDDLSRAERDQQLENLLCASWGSDDKLKLRALERVFAGGRIDENKKIVELDENPVSQALTRPIDTLSLEQQEELANLQLARRALGHAFRPPTWVEPRNARLAMAQLFGPAGPTAQFSEWQARLAQARMPLTPDYLNFLATVDGIGKRMSQPQAADLATQLGEIVKAQDLGEHLGATTTPYRWDTAQLNGLTRADRSRQFRRMIQPARTEVQQRLFIEINSKAARLESRKKENAAPRQAAALGKTVQLKIPEYLEGVVSHSAPGELFVRDATKD